MSGRETGLSRRERQIMEIVYAMGEATVNDVLSRLSDPPGYSAVRATMRILEHKNRLHHVEKGPRYVYAPVVPKERAARDAIKGFLGAYFEGSLENAIASLLSMKKRSLTDEEYQRIVELIRKAREGK